VSVPILKLREVTVRFGGIVALSSVDLDVRPGQIHAVIGPNGAGKSTLINLVTGVYAPTSGEITFDGERIERLRAHAIARRGIARTFQNTELFGELSALDNVMVPLGRSLPYGFMEAALHVGRYAAGERSARERARDYLAQVGLADQASTPAAALSFGQQRRLELARALSMQPKLLLVDEPAAGLRAAEIEELNGILSELRSTRGLSILLVDHVMRLVMAISDRVTVLNFGHKIGEGAPEEVRNDPAVLSAYLGGRAANAHAV
jgi:branched-chain amino acid transport system ATP-binding protein